MSVTFDVTISERDIVLWNLTCETTGGLINDEPLTWELASEVAFAHQVTCPDDLCQHYGPDMDSVITGVRADLAVNMSNSHVRDVLAALGLPVSGDDELVGCIEADDLLGRILIAEAVAPADLGTDTRVADALDVRSDSLSTARSGAQVILCGRAPGYLQGRLADLRALAEHARTIGRTITWA